MQRSERRKNNACKKAMPVTRGLSKASLLKDMGIDVWKLRPPAGGHGKHSEPHGIEVRAGGPAPDSRGVTGNRAAAGNTTAAGNTAAAVNDGTVADEPLPATAIEPFSVFCFAQGNVLLMLQATHAREIGRLGRDLLTGARGNWHSGTHDTQALQETVFSWPPAGLSSTEEEAVKGLQAFTDKQLSQDSPKQLILLNQSIADRLAGMVLPESLVLLPSVAELSDNWELKRDLWLELQTYAI